MAKISREPSIREVTLRQVSEELRRLRKVLNSLDGHNIDWAVEEVTTPASTDTEFSVTHDLGRVPTLWIANPIDKAAVLYDGTTTWTTQEIFLRCDVATVQVRIVIL